MTRVMWSYGVGLCQGSNSTVRSIAGSLYQMWVDGLLFRLLFGRAGHLNNTVWGMCIVPIYVCFYSI